ncbi:FKBP-type peptidyl-prolyl cis-trans isomerase [Spirosoma sp. BT702]|uniref:Peptidyl-prolyl cis-trans isomerase n=1 Tax=Spirosoma profusum TaxID=2771354 RepID=A0A926Y2H3_9BACT|nr:FKBP-type peptidyl-prolyl cis-trans isomerase [Spirosoma profusum]MBD2700791.1 FKBP-type peptidyl-prolyl cis-trans isomerase [Spirosoma profusum]
MRTLPLYIVGALLLGGLASCQPASVDATDDTAAVFESNKIDIENYRVSKGISGTALSSGLYYAITKAGSSSVTPAYGQEIEFNYKLYALTRSASNSAVVTDKVVDSAYATTPAYFPFFASSLKPGLEEGILRMHEGEQAVLLMPSILAFGSTASADIAANSPVRFDITLRRSRTEDQQINEYIAANKWTVTETTANGVRIIKTVDKQTGPFPEAGKTMTLKYAGKLLRATTGFAGGTGTDTKTVGQSKYVPGFEEGLSRLRVGEKATIIFPSSQGYGSAGAGQNGVYVIPPYSPLQFDLEVVSVQ